MVLVKSSPSPAEESIFVHNDSLDIYNLSDKLPWKDSHHIPLISVIHNDIYYSIKPVEYLMDIDNVDQFDLYEFGVEYDINDDNVQVLESN